MHPLLNRLSRIPRSYEELVSTRYGRPPEPEGLSQQAERLLRSGYGRAPNPEPGSSPGRGVRLTLSLSRDAGEILKQRANAAAEYVVPEARDPDEYILPEEAACAAPTVEAGSQPAGERGAMPSLVGAGVVPRSAGSAPETTALAAPAPSAAGAPAAPAAAAPSLPDPAGGGPERASESASADDFIDDLKAILSGEKVFDPRAKQTVDRASVERAAPVSQAASLPAQNPGDAIFERLAQSMQHANAYDIGEVELENRFADFDRIDALRRQADADKRARNAQAARGAGEPASAAPAGVDSAEVLQDLDAIHRQGASVGPAAQRAAPALPVVSPPASAPEGGAKAASALSVQPPLARPLYDTGEHVLAGGNLYVDELHAGQPAPGVALSYGQVIAMADLFESADEMMNAPAGELGLIKKLVERSTAHYSGTGAPDVSDDEWNQATHKRYLRLAEANNEHFSPNFLFPKSPLAPAADAHGDNRRQWQKYHRAAMEAAYADMLQVPANASVKLPLERALTINAFGDHFLTDAFSAGHLVNKALVAELWKASFFNGASLNADAVAFFDRLAQKAFAYPEVKSAFSKLETVKTYFLFWHPNIDSASRLSSVLQGIAEKEPDRIANLVVKAIHDRLNRDGVDVFNDAGAQWHLTGDGGLDRANRAIIEQAVQQSVANINDPSILADNVDYGAYYAKVWRFVPKLTPAAADAVQKLVRRYVGTESAPLVDAAAVLIKDKVKLLVQGLKEANALRDA